MHDRWARGANMHPNQAFHTATDQQNANFARERAFGILSVAPGDGLGSAVARAVHASADGLLPANASHSQPYA